MEDDKTRRAQWNLVAVILAVTFAIMWKQIRGTFFRRKSRKSRKRSI